MRELELGARGKVEGAAMALGGAIRAPLSGRECVFWVVDDGPVRHTSEVSFLIADGEGARVLIETARCVIDMPRDEIVGRDGRAVLEGIIAPGDTAFAWGIVTGTNDVSFIDGYRSATNVAWRIRSTSIDRAVIGRLSRAPK